MKTILKCWLCLLAVLAARTGMGGETPSTETPDYSSGAFVALRATYARTLADIHAARIAGLIRLTQVNLDNAETMLREKTKARNVTGIAVASNARSLFEGLLTNLVSTGEVKLPVKVRRELDPLLDEFRRGVKTIEEEFEAARAILRKETLDRFKALAVLARPNLAGDAAAETVNRDFQEWAEGKYDASASTPKAQAAAVTAEGAAPAAGVTVLGSSGEAASWATLAHWEGRSRTLEVVTLALAQMQVGTNTFEDVNPGTETTTRHRYCAMFAFPQGRTVPVRLKSCPGKEGVEILEWPSPQNDYTLSIRMASSNDPGTHAFDLQVGADEKRMASLLRGAALESTAGKNVAVSPAYLSVTTLPPGASVVVDGVPVATLKTPCRIPIPVGTHTVALTLSGYLPMSLSNETFSTNRTVKWKFIPNPRIITKTCALSADVNQWYPSGIMVRNDAMITVRAEGLWSCGAKGEPCSPDGYPTSVPTYRHYSDSALRQVTEARYGALLARIGKEGAPVVVGQASRFKATLKGMLYFDINEAVGKEARADNTGRLTLSVSISEPEGPVPGR